MVQVVYVICCMLQYSMLYFCVVGAGCLVDDIVVVRSDDRRPRVLGRMREEGDAPEVAVEHIDGPERLVAATSELYYVATCCGTLQHVVLRCAMLQHFAHSLALQGRSRS